MTYEAMRAIAGSWGMLFALVFFVGVVIFVFRPRSKATYEHMSRIPLDDDKAPLEKDDKRG
jgi:cytochrome c oxidase cbb3-type subunit 4